PARRPLSLVRVRRRGPARDGILEVATLERLEALVEALVGRGRLRRDHVRGEREHQRREETGSQQPTGASHLQGSAIMVRPRPLSRPIPAQRRYQGGRLSRAALDEGPHLWLEIGSPERGPRLDRHGAFVAGFEAELLYGGLVRVELRSGHPLVAEDS